jgi:dCTP deaminase
MLSGVEITRRLCQKQIHIEPFDNAQVNINSYDVRIAGDYLCSKPICDLYIPELNQWEQGKLHKWKDIYLKHGPPNDELYKSKYKEDDEFILLAPGQMILAHTIEEIGTDSKSNLTTMMHAKSTTVRNHLSVCRCGGLGNVGYKSKWTMEIKNESNQYYIPILVGSRIAQISFIEVIGEVPDAYKGKYNSIEWSIDSMRPK